MKKLENQFWFLEDESRKLYYDMNKKQWVKRNDYTGQYYPAAFPCHSYRAAERHLRKHDEIPKGMIFRLSSKFIGMDRFLTKGKSYDKTRHA